MRAVEFTDLIPILGYLVNFYIIIMESCFNLKSDFHIFSLKFAQKITKMQGWLFWLTARIFQCNYFALITVLNFSSYILRFG
jgi:hypothetical protein